MITERKFYNVIGNTDLNEGRGSNIIIARTPNYNLAKHIAKHAYVQGTDAPIEEDSAFYIEKRWFKEIVVLNLTLVDYIEQQSKIKELEQLEKQIKILKEELRTTKTTMPWWPYPTGFAK